MPALEPLAGLRVVATPTAIDVAHWHGDNVTVLRFAPDDVFAIGATGVELDDDDAIIESEVGFGGAWVTIPEVMRHLEWELPVERPVLAQGSIANVPAKLWLPDVRDRILLLTAAAYADELEGRLR